MELRKKKIPDLIFIIDTNKSSSCRKTWNTIIAVLDTNSDTGIDSIPGNDDAKLINLY